MGLVDHEMIEWEPSGYPTVIAFDPGGTTGWSVLTVHPEALSDPDVPILDNLVHQDHGQIEGDEHGQVDRIIDMLDLWDGSAVVFEDFHLRTIAAELSPVRIANTVSWAMTRLFDPPRNMYLQMPSEKDQASDDRLKRWGLYRADGCVHARDADRHGIIFLRRAKKNPRVRASAFPHLYQ